MIIASFFWIKKTKRRKNKGKKGNKKRERNERSLDEWKWDYEKVKTYSLFIIKFYLKKIRIKNGGWKKF